MALLILLMLYPAFAIYVLILAQVNYLVAEDVAELIGMVQSVKRRINPLLKVGGVFLIMVNEPITERTLCDQLRKILGTTDLRSRPSFLQ